MQSPCHKRGTSSKFLLGSRLRTSTDQNRPRFCFARGNFRSRIWDRLRSPIAGEPALVWMPVMLELFGICHQFMRGIREQESKGSKLRTLGNYEVHVAWEGFASIRQISSGEIMHSRTPPMEEARKLYVEQSNLAERVRLSASENPQNATPLVLWDVGLGAAANAMAAILCYEEQAEKASVRALEIISF